MNPPKGPKGDDVARYPFRVTSPLIFPVGHYLGTHYPGAGADLDFHVVRIGWEIYRLEGNEQFGVWALAHGVPDQGDATAAWTRPALEGAARASGLAGVSSALDDLLAKDLIIEVTAETEEAVEFARVCRIRSLLVGLGNTAEDPLHFGIGLPAGQPIMQASTFDYELWKWGHACDSLWHACNVLAQAGRDVDPADPEQTDPSRILTRVLSTTQNLISHGAAYLDEAREE
jgi:hypothetical protein